MEIPNIELSFWPILFLIAGGQGLFFSALVFKHHKGNRLSSIYLGLLLFLFSYMLFFHFCWWTNYHYHFPHVYLTNTPIYYCFSPLLLLYFDSLRVKPQLQKHRWAHFLPSLLLIFFLLPFFLQGTADKLATITGEAAFPQFSFGSWVWIMVNFKLFGTQMLIYLLWKIWLLQKIWKEDEAAGLAPKLVQVRRKWFQILTALFAAYTLSFLAYFPLSKQAFFVDLHDFIISGIMTISIYTIGYLGYQRPAIFSGELLQKVFQPNKYATSSLTNSAAQSIQNALLKLMENEKPYRNNELKIGTLAESLQITSHHLSQVINDQFGKTFNQFINDFRIQEAKQLLENPDYEKAYIIQIAYEVGFNNKTTFNATFKKSTGQSPSQYRQEFYEKVRLN